MRTSDHRYCTGMYERVRQVPENLPQANSSEYHQLALSFFVHGLGKY